MRKSRFFTAPEEDLALNQLLLVRSCDLQRWAGFTHLLPRLGIPAIQMADVSVGVTRGGITSRYSTLLPDTVSAASSWNTKLACEYGALIGPELRDQGYDIYR